MSISQSYKSDFFSGKRPWSLIKDEILKKYLPPYLKKVNTLDRGIIIVDGFAGPGIFDDGTRGSPMIIYDIVKSIGGDNVKIILVNKDPKHHLKLNKILADQGQTGNIITILGTAEDLLKQLKSELTNETLFVYLDQFGISGFDFSTLVPYLTRTKAHSTEFLMNICVPVIHRLSRKRKFPNAGSTVYGDKILTSVFGGDYWKTHLFDSIKTPDEQINGLMIEYSSKLRNYLDYIGFCPVFEKGPGSQ
ncbi:MAG: three-Cys-motif partner protein TcmP, partial [Bacteroidales bacterium]